MPTSPFVRTCLAAGALALLTLGCGTRTSKPVPTPEAPPEIVKARDALVHVPNAESLRGTDLHVREDGVWVVRSSTGSGSSGAGVAGRRGGDLRRLERSVLKSAEVEGTRFEEDGGPTADAAVVDGMAMPKPSGPSGETIGIGGGASRVPAGAPPRSRRDSGTPLKAGSTDDNAEYEAYLKFLATWFDKDGVADRARDIDVSERRFVRVLDAQGRPVPAAIVTFIDETGDRVAWQGRTLGDGRMMFFPRAVKGDAPSIWRVEVRYANALTEVRYDGAGDLHIGITNEVVAPEIVALDVCFVIDTTGSMSDEIERIKNTLLSVTKRLKGLAVEFDLRYGAVLYRDITDNYVTKRHPFTGDIEAFAKALRKVDAGGGGDMPESMNQGLAEATGQMAWREGAAKLCFLVADAPPHMDYEGDVGYDVSMRAALEKGIRIHSVAASGLDAFGSLVMRQVAQFTGGQFLFIEYGGNVKASGEAHGVSGAKKSNNLDDIIFERIQDEIAGWGRAQQVELTGISLAAPLTE